jgi:ubiquinone/menaquinone biosynthesis C-methylase UbiE
MQQTELVTAQFGATAHAYLTSAVHAQGEDLEHLKRELATSIPEAARANSSILDVGCGAGHASFAAASLGGRVTAVDLSEDMLAVVNAAARERGWSNIVARKAAAEHLPFDNGEFCAVISRMSAHHWRDVPAALREIRRVLKPEGKLVLIDIAGSQDPLCDTWLQSVELLRDPSHVRDYTGPSWRAMVEEAGFAAPTIQVSPVWRIAIDFDSWVQRMRTAAVAVEAIRHLWQVAPSEVREHYRVRADGSFELEALMLTSRAGD